MNKNVIFFHNDLDGIMSALFLSLALNKEMIYIPANHDKQMSNLIDRYKSLNYKVYIVDFPPNEQADFCADHHLTSDNKFKLIDSNKKLYDPAASSCAGLIARHFGLSQYKEIIELVDKVDSFAWEKPEDAVKTRYDFIYSKLLLADSNIDFCMKKSLKILKNHNSLGFFKRASELIFGEQAVKEQIKKLEKLNEKTKLQLKDKVYKNFIHLISDDTEELNRNMAYVEGFDGVVSEYHSLKGIHIAVVLNKFKGNKFDKADVSEICKKMSKNGGGHKMAAGFTSDHN